MENIPIFGCPDAIPPRVGKLWLTHHKDYGSPDIGTAFFYRTATYNAETFDASQPGKVELRDYVRKHCSDPSPGFGSIIISVRVSRYSDGPIPTDMADPKMGMIYMMAIDDLCASDTEGNASDIQMLAGDTLGFSPNPHDVAWQWSAFRYHDKAISRKPEDYWINHVAVRPQEGLIHTVRCTYPDHLDAGVGYRTFLRFLYEWETSVRRVAAGEDAIAPLAIPEEEDWGDLVAALEEAPTPEELIVRR